MKCIFQEQSASSLPQRTHFRICTFVRSWKISYCPIFPCNIFAISSVHDTDHPLIGELLIKIRFKAKDNYFYPCADVKISAHDKALMKFFFINIRMTSALHRKNIKKETYQLPAYWSKSFGRWTMRASHFFSNFLILYNRCKFSKQVL